MQLGRVTLRELNTLLLLWSTVRHGFRIISGTPSDMALEDRR